MAPIALFVHTPVKPEKAAEFEAVVQEEFRLNLEKAPGVLLSQMLKGKEPGDYAMFEIYANAKTLKAHGEHPHVIEANRRQREGKMFRAAPTMQVLQVVGPPGMKKGPVALGIAATLKVKAGAGEDFEKVTLPLLEEVQAKESGNLLYMLGKDPKDPTKYVVLELYSGVDAVKHHGRTDYFKAGGKRQAPFMDGRPKIEMLTTVGPSNARL